MEHWREMVQGNGVNGLDTMPLSVENLQPINDQCSPSYRNQSIDLHCESIGWFVYEGEYWLVINGLRKPEGK